MIKTITFGYKEDDDACCESEFDGCCCHCVSHKEVFKHCCQSPHTEEEGCVCSQSLGFYVCTIWSEMDNEPMANLSGKHGMCECFVRRKEEK